MEEEEVWKRNRPSIEAEGNKKKLKKQKNKKDACINFCLVSGECSDNEKGLLHLVIGRLT